MESKKSYSSEELLVQLLNHIDDNIYFKDRDSRFILINEAFAQRLNMRPEDVVGKTDFDIFTEEHARPAFEAEKQIMETGEPLIGLEEKETWANGHRTWVSTTKMPMRDDEGNIFGTFGISRDITEHKLNELKVEKYARKLAQINRQLREDLHMAANLQLAFLPQFYPNFPEAADGKCVEFFHRYIASKQISGDLCAIHKLNDSEAGMLVCDVMGHGVRSALITAIVHTMIGDLTRRNLPPGEFFSEMNRQLRPIFKSQDSFIFVTASYLVLNVETGTLRGASAGHTTPLIIHNQTPLEVAPLQAAEHINGPALAIVQNIDYKTFEMQLAPGDAVLMYTDGVLEEPNEDNEEFGMERVQESLRRQPDNHPETLCNALINAVCNFQECTQLDDDVCLLGFRWNGPSN